MSFKTSNQPLQASFQSPVSKGTMQHSWKATPSHTKSSTNPNSKASNSAETCRALSSQCRQGHTKGHPSYSRTSSPQKLGNETRQTKPERLPTHELAPIQARVPTTTKATTLLVTKAVASLEPPQHHDRTQQASSQTHLRPRQPKGKQFSSNSPPTQQHAFCTRAQSSPIPTNPLASPSCAAVARMKGRHALSKHATSSTSRTTSTRSAPTSKPN